MPDGTAESVRWSVIGLSVLVVSVEGELARSKFRSGEREPACDAREAYGRSESELHAR